MLKQLIRLTFLLPLYSFSENRFKALTHKAKEVDQLLVSREAKAKAKQRKSRLASTMSQSGQKNLQPTHHEAAGDDIALSQLYSTRAFAEFLKARPNYNPPAFLAAILYDVK